MESARASALARYTSSVDPNQLVSYHWQSRPISTRLHSRLRQTRLIILWRILENSWALSPSGVRATFEGPIPESSHFSLPLGGESVFVTRDNKSSTSRFSSRRQPPVSWRLCLLRDRYMAYSSAIPLSILFRPKSRCHSRSYRLLKEGGLSTTRLDVSTMKAPYCKGRSRLVFISIG